MNTKTKEKLIELKRKLWGFRNTKCDLINEKEYKIKREIRKIIEDDE